MGEFHHFDFVKLMIANQPPGVAAGASRFLTEARRVGREVNRQILGIQNFTAVKVGQRHLGGGNQEKVFFFQMESVLLKFGKLAGAGHAFAVDHIGRGHFGVILLYGVHIEHEIDEGAF